MLYKMLYIALVILATEISCEFKIPIRFGNITVYDRPDGRKDIIITQGIDVGGYGGISGLTFFEKNGTFETSDAGAVLLNGKLYGNNHTLSYNKQGVDMETKYHFGNKTFHGGPGREGQALGEFLAHIGGTVMKDLEEAAKRQKERQIGFLRRKRNFHSQ